MAPPRAVVTDIEGTVTRISFVHDVLFPYARAHLDSFLAANAARPDIAALLADVRGLSPDMPERDALRHWMDEDAKVTPLKTLQGLIWAEGYASGALQAALYADVAPALRRWHDAGITLGVYSSGSVAAQKLLFAHAAEGDLTPLFRAYFDTRIGAKREPASYTAIAAAIGFAPADILFLSDIAAELDAAHVAGLAVCQLLRPEDGTLASAHPGEADFAGVGRRYGLP